jgi:hypothetical protein
MRVELFGLAFETPRATFFLRSPWRASYLEHRLFEAVRGVARAEPEEAADELRVHVSDPKAWRAALQATTRVLKGWEEEADPASEKRAWRWMLEADANHAGYDHAGEPASLWGFVRLSLDRGGVGEPDKGEDIDLDWFGVQVHGERPSG